jgi:hypothetical protein
MIMKTFFLITFLGIFPLLSFAQSNQGLEDVLKDYEQYHSGVVSKSGNALAIVYCQPEGIYRPNVDSLASDKPIHFGFVLTTNSYSVVFILLPEYGFRISATTTNGEPIKFTREGSRFGRYFDHVVGFDKHFIDPTRNERHGSIPNWYNVWPSDQMPNVGNALPAPDDLFEFKKDGYYKMKIETACFLCLKFTNTIQVDPTNYSVEKFPSVELTIKVAKSGGNQ